MGFLATDFRSRDVRNVSTFDSTVDSFDLECARFDNPPHGATPPRRHTPRGPRVGRSRPRCRTSTRGSLRGTRLEPFEIEFFSTAHTSRIPKNRRSLSARDISDRFLNLPPTGARHRGSFFEPHTRRGETSRTVHTPGTPPGLRSIALRSHRSRIVRSDSRFSDVCRTATRRRNRRFVVIPTTSPRR
jgi:hypothetical protein